MKNIKNFENFIDINKNNAFVLKLLKYDSIDNSNYSSNNSNKFIIRNNDNIQPFT